MSTTDAASNTAQAEVDRLSDELAANHKRLSGAASNAEATARPWRVEEGTDVVWGACNPADPSTRGMGYPICRGQSYGWHNRPTFDEREANADLIVRAVNSFDAFRDALVTIAAGYGEPVSAGIAQKALAESDRRKA